MRTMRVFHNRRGDCSPARLSALRKLPSQRRRLLSRPSLLPLRQDAAKEQAEQAEQAELAADIKELQELKAQNNEILKDQQAALDVLEQLEKDADQLRIYSKRG